MELKGAVLILLTPAQRILRKAKNIAPRSGAIRQGYSWAFFLAFRLARAALLSPDLSF